jgi:hypothetical protein
MALIDITYVQDNFYDWQIYCTLEGQVAADVLQVEINRSIEEFNEYLDRTDDTISDEEKRHILNIAKYNCFKIKHGDTEFKTKPVIVTDYERTIKKLEKYRLGKSGKSGAGDIQMTGLERRFEDGQWFTDSGDELSS